MTVDSQGRPNNDHRPVARGGDLPAETGSPLTSDLRSEAEEQGRDPEEVDPLELDEDVMRRMSSPSGVKMP